MEGLQWFPRELSTFSFEEQFPVLSKLIRGEGQNAGRLHIALSKELEQRLRSTDRVKCIKGTSSERFEVHNVPQG